MAAVARTGSKPVPIEDRVTVVLSVLAGELTMADAARRYGVASTTVAGWRDRFVDAGTAGLLDQLSGPAGPRGTQAERRLRAETEQLKLALAEATVQLRIWKKGAEFIEEVPSSPSRRSG
jgi:transposase